MFEYVTTTCGKRVVHKVAEERVSRIKEEVSQGRIRELNPGDFFIAYKLGIAGGALQTDKAPSEMSFASNKERADFVRQNAELSVGYLRQVTGFSSSYINKIKRR